MLSNLMKMCFNDDGHTLLSDSDLRDMFINFMLAGQETTYAMLSWFFCLLIQHPDVEEKILLEIQRILNLSPSNNDYNSHKGFVMEDLKEMHYLHVALSETLRLYPPVLLNVKELVEDELVLPGRRVLKKGTVVLQAIYSMGRMEKIWGKYCREFKPERWLKHGVFTSQDGFKFPVFNAQPRVCLGKDFSYLQMKWVVASILSQYCLKLEDENVVAMPKFGLSLFIKNGLRVTLHPQSE